FSGIEQFRISKLFVIRNHRLFKQFEDYRSELGKRWQLRPIVHSEEAGEELGRNCEPGFDSHISPEAKEIVLFQSAQVLPIFIIRFVRVASTQIVEEEL
ncbi:unnamed protein product, partial [Rotaria magnacalcarata]